MTGEAQTDGQGGGASWPERIRTTLSEQPMRRWGIGLGALVLAVSGLFGGWKPAPAPPPAAVNSVVDGGSWRVTITGARLVGELKPMVLSDKGNHWVVVLATVEITAERTWKHIHQILTLSGVDGVKDGPARDVLLMRDATKISQLNPGLPEKVAFFWEHKAGSPVPTEITVQVQAWQFRVNSLTQGREWMPDDDAMVEVRVPVADRREAAS